jgi:hypothetical protein
MEFGRKNTPNFQARPVCGDEFSGGETNGSFQLNSLPAKYEELKRCNNGESDSGPKQIFCKPSQMLIIRRFLLFTFSLGCGLLLFIIGWQYFYNDRRLLGASLIGCGWLCAFGGLGYWWLNAFPAAWGWPL